MSIEDRIVEKIQKIAEEQPSFPLNKKCRKSVADATLMILKCFTRGNKVLIFGNGGSASDAQHIATEFIGRFHHKRRALPAIALAADATLITAIGNDYGFEHVFSRQIEALGSAGDIAIAISTSGLSKNILRAVQTAHDGNLQVIALTGDTPSPLISIADTVIQAPLCDTAGIQEFHRYISHVICRIIDDIVSTRFDIFNGTQNPFYHYQSQWSTKIKTIDWLITKRNEWRKQNKLVVWTNGCFDLLHPGHISSLEQARSFGDILIVGVNGDRSVRELKGRDRPIMPASDRLRLITALSCVDFVLLFDELSPTSIISTLQPDFCCKGEDYAEPNGTPMPEKSVVESYGGHVVYTRILPGYSTSTIVSAIRNSQ